ncbi:hypothetical protein [Herbiconiux sp. VKM Ac-2851]|uniref:hypothetical protein n=1 Tax=Herbiconiux sp. VKM Ac-2851 TaxID=2739025 RepID=UPI0015634B11|nr:hypothetical protein [Herbiconiux sp. VKM Ac-2851]NQX34112.1 hypothetical protein [Herbiconiux sp. VKM Ac-2851]
MSENGAAGQAAQVKDTATAQAGQLKDTATTEAGHVAGVAKDEAARVAHEAGSQVRDLYQRTQSELKDQAGEQQQRAAAGLRSLGEELGRMASSQDSPGVASDLVGQAASRVGAVGDWLEGRDPGSLLDEVKSFARRKPGTFIAVAAVAGVLAGRLTRSLASGGSSDTSITTTSSTSTGSSTGSAGSTGDAPVATSFGAAETVAPATTTPAYTTPVVPPVVSPEDTPVYTERVQAQGDEGLRP